MRASSWLQLEHLELLHKQLVIVMPHRENSSTPHSWPWPAFGSWVLSRAPPADARPPRARDGRQAAEDFNAGPEDRPVRVERVDVGRPLPGVVVIAAHDATAVEQRDREVAARRGDLPLAAVALLADSAPHARRSAPPRRSGSTATVSARERHGHGCQAPAALRLATPGVPPGRGRRAGADLRPS